MTVLERPAEQYLRSVSAALPCTRREKARYLRDLRGSLDRYVTAHPSATAIQLRARFGAPEEIAEDYVAADPGRIARTLTAQRRFRRTVTALAICGVVLLGVLCGIAVKSYEDRTAVIDGYVVEVIQEDAASADYLEALRDDVIEVYITK